MAKVIIVDGVGVSCIVFDKSGAEITRRELGNVEKRFQVSLPFQENISIGGNCKVLGRHIVERSFINIKLPDPEKEVKIKNLTFRKIANWHSPASINIEKGLIITNDYFETLSKAQQIFILEHEKGHFRYNTEKFCDLFAAKELINRGFGFSQCLEVLRKTLTSSPEKEDRYNFVFENLKKYDKGAY